MNALRIIVPAAALAGAALLLLNGADSARIKEDEIWRHRNLGKAFYENPTTKQQAVDEFQQALAIAPDSAREKLNYALALLRAGGHEQEAVKLLEEVERQDPSLPHPWFNLGIYYKHQGDANRAIAQFEGMISRVPGEAIAHFQLGLLYLSLGYQQPKCQLPRGLERDRGTKQVRVAVIVADIDARVG